MGRVIVSGCFDNLHSGHIVFLQIASMSGELHVVVAKDETIRQLKHREPFCDIKERLYCVQSLRCVHEAVDAKGVGELDFIDHVLPGDCFIVNTDGHSEQKEQAVKSKGANYKVLMRLPERGLPKRTTTTGLWPYRIEIAGAWLDQPAFRGDNSGVTITASIIPQAFKSGSGLAGSVRDVARRIWKTVPDNYEEAAKILFCASNSPEYPYVSGAQDSIGLCYPGISIAYYVGKEWYPYKIQSIVAPEVIKFIEDNYRLFYVGERPKNWCPVFPKHVDKELVSEFYRDTLAILHKITFLSPFSLCSQRILQDRIFGGQLLSEKFTSMILLFDWKFNGAGGGGYALVKTKEESEQLIKFRIRL